MLECQQLALARPTRTKLGPQMTMGTALLAGFRVERALAADGSAIDSAP
jgi:hypothetical protein